MIEPQLDEGQDSVFEGFAQELHTVLVRLPYAPGGRHRLENMRRGTLSVTQRFISGEGSFRLEVV
jgi:hypothetical protein